MTLWSVFRALVITELAALGVATLLIIGRDQIAAVRGEVRDRVRTTLPYFGALGVILAVNKVARTVGPEISWIIGLNITTYLHRFEGSFVASVQSVATPALTAYFSAMYVYGYVFILLFPILAYLFHDDVRWLRRLVAAYSVNYAIGLCFYVLFVSYGPRNLIPGLVEPLLYTSQPSMQLLVTEINTNTNVFPSLHTSLATTVALFAYLTRETYPRWQYVAAALAVSVDVSTMYLGIHWGTDVVAGIALAFLSVRLAHRAVPATDGQRDQLADEIRPSPSD